MIFKNLCFLVLWRKVASALEGLINSVFVQSVVLLNPSNSGAVEVNECKYLFTKHGAQ